MAKTRTQQQAATTAAPNISALRRATRAGTSKTGQKSTKYPSKVQFSETVHVKSIPNKDDAHIANPGDVLTPEQKHELRRKHEKLVRECKAVLKRRQEERQKGKVHTFSTLATPPTTDPTPEQSTKSTGYTRPSRSNVHTLTDFAPASPITPQTPTHPSTPPTQARPTIPEPLTDVGHKPTDRRSSLLKTPSPRTVLSRKRVRPDESDFYSPPTKRIMFEYNAEADLSENLRRRPRCLAPEEISALFHVFRGQLRAFSFDHFNFELTPAAREAWPLEDMEDAHRPLMLTAQYISDGSQYGWRSFFTTPDSRASLVYGVIAEYLKHHVFSMPAFGLPDEATRRVENVDTQYMYADAHVRARHRAYEMRNILENEDWRGSSNEAIRRLAEDLLDVLTPLLPPEIFAHNESTGSFEVRRDQIATEVRRNLLHDLQQHIESAVNLHYSICLTGQDGSIVRFCNQLTKGDKWFGDYEAPQKCVNKSMIHKTQFHGWASNSAYGRTNALQFSETGVAGSVDDRSAPRRPRVRMICFPRVEMIVPRGPDLEQLGQLQEELAKLYPVKKNVEAGAPGDDDSDDNGDDGNDDDDDDDGKSSRRSSVTPSKRSNQTSNDEEEDHIVQDQSEIDWKALEDRFAAQPYNGPTAFFRGKDHIWEKAPAMVQHQYEQRKGKWNAENDGDLRLAYQMHYQWISPNDVYLEHDYVEPTREGFVEKYFDRHSEPIVEPTTAEETRRVNREVHRLPKEDRKAAAAAALAADKATPDDEITTTDDNTSISSDEDEHEIKYRWAPGHSRQTGLAAYDEHIRYLRGEFLDKCDNMMRWHYGKPIPVEERKSLKAAIAEARAAVTQKSTTKKLKFAATDATRSVWNAIAGQATMVEWGASTVAFAFAMLWLYRWRKTGLPSLAAPRFTDHEAFRYVEGRIKEGIQWSGEQYNDVKRWLGENEAALGRVLSSRGQGLAAATQRTATRFVKEKDPVGTLGHVRVGAGAPVVQAGGTLSM